MHTASVGFHCPECTKNAKQKVYTTRNLPGNQAFVTKSLIALNVVVFLAAIPLADATLFSDGRLAQEIAVNGRAIDEFGHWWRVITGGFGHFGLIHIGFNMYVLWWLGRSLERSLGPVVFVLAYFASLIAGSLGALIASPNALTMGASGAVFGLMGLIVMHFRSRGIGLQESGFGRILFINLIISLSGFVSLGGHAGGFLAGIVLGALFFGVNPGDGPIVKGRNAQIGVTIGLSIVLFAASLWAATTWVSPLF